MSYDFNDAEPQRAGFSGDLIPDGTVVLVAMTVRPGGQDDGGWLKASKDGGALMLDAEFTIDGGDYDRRKLWGNYVIKGSTEGHDKAAGISRSFLRAALESSRNIMPSDASPARCRHCIGVVAVVDDLDRRRRHVQRQGVERPLVRQVDDLAGGSRRDRIDDDRCVVRPRREREPCADELLRRRRREADYRHAIAVRGARRVVRRGR